MNSISRRELFEHRLPLARLAHFHLIGQMGLKNDNPFL